MAEDEMVEWHYQRDGPFLHTRRGLTLLSQLCRDSVIRVRSGAFEARRGTLRFLPQLVIRPSSIAPNPVEFRLSTELVTTSNHISLLTGGSPVGDLHPGKLDERSYSSVAVTPRGCGVGRGRDFQWFTE